MNIFRKTRLKTTFNQWIDEHSPALYRHALWMTGHQDVATEMVQEAFFQAWNSIETLKDSGKALPWLLTLLRRAVYRQQRYQYRHAETVEQLHAMDAEKSEADSFQLLLVYRTLEALTPDHRDILLLHHLHGFSYAEISEQLQIPRGTVMSRLSRARETLAKLEQADADSPVIQLDRIRNGSRSNG